MVSFIIFLLVLFPFPNIATKVFVTFQQTIDEFATRVGQQAVVLVGTPGKPNNSFKCFGAKPLEDVVSKTSTNILLVQIMCDYTLI